MKPPSVLLSAWLESGTATPSMQSTRDYDTLRAASAQDVVTQCVLMIHASYHRRVRDDYWRILAHSRVVDEAWPRPQEEVIA